MTDLGNAYVRVRPNMASFEGETLAGIKSTFKKAATIIGASYGAAEAFKFGKEALNDAASVQKSQELIRSEFGKSGNALIKWADTAGIHLGAAAHLSEDTAARFGILFHNMGIGKSQAADMTLNLEKLAASLAAARGVDPESVFARLPLALAGNVRGLKQLGIAIDGASIKQEALKLGFTHIVGASNQAKVAQEKLAIAQAEYGNALSKYGAGTTQVASAQLKLQAAQAKVNSGVKSAVDALTPAQRAQVIYELATKNLTHAQQDAAKHSGDYANVQRRLSAEWDRSREIIGGELLPVFAKYGTELGKNLESLNKSGKLQKDVNAVVKDGVSAFKLIASAIGKTYDVVQKIIDVFGSAAGAAGAFMAVIAVKKIVAITSAIRSSLIASGFAELQIATEAEKTAYLAAFGEMEIATIGLSATIKSALISTGIGALVVAAGIAADLIITHWGTVKKWFGDFWGWLKTAAKDAVDFIKGVFFGWIAAVIGELKLLADAAAKALGWLPGIGGKLKEAARAIDGWYTTFKDKSLKAFGDIGSTSAKNFADAYVSTLTAQQARMAAAAGIQTTTSGASSDSRRQSGAGGGSRSSTGHFSESQMTKLLVQAGASSQLAGILAHIAYYGESSGDPHATGYNKNKAGQITSIDRGLFQINSSHGYGTSSYNPMQAAKQALSIYHAQGFGAWTEAYGRAAVAKYGNWLKSGGGGGGGGGGGNDTSLNPLVVGSTVTKLTSAQVAAAKKSLDSTYAAILDTIRKNGVKVSGKLKSDMAAARKEISTVATSSDIANARSDLTKFSRLVSDQVSALRTHLSLMKTFDGVTQQAKKLGVDITPPITAAMATVRKEIGKAVTPAEVAKVQTQMTHLKNVIAAQVTAIKAQADTIRGAFETAFGRLASSEDTAFDEATQKALASLQVLVNAAGSSFLFGGSVTQTPAEAALAALQAKHDSDAAAAQLASDRQALTDAQSAGSPEKIAAATDVLAKSQRDLASAQTAASIAQDRLNAVNDVAAKSTPLQVETAEAALTNAQNRVTDLENAVADAQDKLTSASAPTDGATLAQLQAAIDSDLYNGKVSALQAQAQLERDAANQQLSDAQAAYQKQRDILKQQMDDRVQAIETGMEDGTITAADGMAKLTNVFSDPQYGIDIQNSGTVIAGSFYKGLSDGLVPVFALFDELADKMREIGLLPSGAPNTNVKPTSGAVLPGGLHVPGTGTIDMIAAALKNANKPVVDELQKQTDILSVAPPGRLPASVAR